MARRDNPTSASWNPIRYDSTLSVTTSTFGQVGEIFMAPVIHS